LLWYCKNHVANLANSLAHLHLQFSVAGRVFFCVRATLFQCFQRGSHVVAIFFHFQADARVIARLGGFSFLVELRTAQLS
jgi:hypothetical protein